MFGVIITTGQNVGFNIKYNYLTNLILCGNRHFVYFGGYYGDERNDPNYKNRDTTF